MSGWEKIIGDAIFGVTSEDVGLARVAVKMATCDLMFCPQCGSIMDQSRTIVSEAMAAGSELGPTMVACGVKRSDNGSRCEPSRSNMLRVIGDIAERYPDKPRIYFHINTWDGIERFPAED